MGKFKDLTGQKFGKYTVIEFGKEQKWKCQCECGHVSFMRGYNLTMGKSKGCRACSNRLNKGETGFNNLFSKYKGRASKYNREFSLSKKDFRIITSLPCHYCGVHPYKKSKSGSHTSEGTKRHSAYTYNGIDRVDSSIGYTIQNSVPCCEICNKAKRDMSYEEFMNYIKRIIIHYEKKNTNNS